MTAHSVPDGALAGYRLVRKLAVGSRADVYLGVGTSGTVALKVFAPHTPRESVWAELDALGRIDSPHFVRLRDVSSSSGALPILVLERVTQGSVSALMKERQSLECGEAVTMLAPIATLVAQLHDAGVAHGKIGPASVHLGSRGEPVLLGLGHCELFAPGSSMAVIDKEPAAAADRDALAVMALDILARVRSRTGDVRVRALTEWIENAPRAYEFPTELAERLFACAEPLPVTIMAERRLAESVSTRPRNPAPAEPHAASDRSAPPITRGWMQMLLDSPVEFAKRHALTLARGVRPRFWIVSGAVAFALVLAVVLIPAGGTPQSARAVSGTAAPSAAAPSIRSMPSTPSPAITALPDDPLLASKSLLAERLTCIRELSILCLDRVDEASSAAFASDAALIQRVQEGGEIPKSETASAVQLTVTERLGDTALIALGSPSGPTSILVIRRPTGWRIRDYLTGAQATTAPAG